MISSIDTLPRTNVSYLGWEETLKNKDKLDEFNSRFDIKLDDKNLQTNFQQTPDEKKASIVEKKEQIQKTDEVNKNEVYRNEVEKKPATDIENTTKLTQALHHNVLQNIPTQDILRLRASI